MPVVAADTLQLSAVRETVPGVTPTSPVFQVWRTTGESLSFAPQTSQSGELGGSGRFSKPANVTGMTISGDINFELAPFPALEQAMASVLAANWGECPATGAVGGGIESANRITVGKTMQTFTVEKRFPNPAFVRGTIVSATMTGIPGASATLTITGGPNVGSGVIALTLAVSNGPVKVINVPFDPPQTATEVATAVVAAITAKAYPGITATSAAGVVTINTATGTFTSGSARTGQDEYFYQRYTGVTYSRLSLTVAPNSPVTGTVSTTGGVPTLDVLPITGATYVSAGNKPVFTAPEVLQLSVGTALGIGTHCWTNLSINLDSQNRGIPCIGTKGDREVVLGTLTAQVTGDVYFSDQAILEAILANETVGNSVITLSNSAGDVYRWDFYGMKPVAGQLSAGGAGQDLTMPLTFEPTPKNVCGGWESGLILSKVNTAPVLP